VPGAPGVSAGLGFRWLVGRVPWGMDYAFVPWGVFGGEHAVSLTFGIVPRSKKVETLPAPVIAMGVPPEVFYPLKGERVRYGLKVEARAEVSALLLDEGGLALATLFEKQIVEPGDHEVVWDGRLPNGEWADFDRTYRILIQSGGQTWYKDVIPKRE